MRRGYEYGILTILGARTCLFLESIDSDSLLHNIGITEPKILVGGGNKMALMAGIIAIVVVSVVVVVAAVSAIVAGVKDTMDDEI